MAKVTKEQARKSVEAYKRNRKPMPKPKAKPAAKKGKPANWLTRLSANVKVEMAKRAQKKAYKNLSAAEKREDAAKKRKAAYRAAWEK